MEKANFGKPATDTFQKWERLEVLKGECPSCGKEALPDDLHGTIVRPTETIAVIEGAGICRDCNVLMPLKTRIRDNLAIEWVNDQGRWMRRDNYGTRPIEEDPPKSMSLKVVCKTLAYWWWIFLTLMMPMVMGVLHCLTAHG